MDRSQVPAESGGGQAAHQEGEPGHLGPMDNRPGPGYPGVDQVARRLGEPGRPRRADSHQVAASKAARGSLADRLGEVQVAVASETAKGCLAGRPGGDRVARRLGEPGPRQADSHQAASVADTA